MRLALVKVLIRLKSDIFGYLIFLHLLCFQQMILNGLESFHLSVSCALAKTGSLAADINKTSF